MDSHQLKPRDGFLVTNINYFSNLSNQILTDLYLPIIGTKAYTIYLYLWSLTSQKLVSIDRYEHTRLINSVGESLKEIKSSLVKLEGIGLVRTFYKKDIIGDLYLYELSSPVTPVRFFNDDLLSSYLLEMVGEKTFSDLVEKYTLHPANTNKFTEITSSFFDAFNLDTVSFVHETTSLNFQKERTPESQKFDQKLFLTLMEKFGINNEIIKQNLKTIEEISNFYNINELEISNALINSGCLKNDKFSSDKLMEYFNVHLNKKGNESVPKKDLDLQNLSDEEKKIIEKAKNLSPIDFLRQMKEQFGGYITNSEASTLRKLVNRHILPNEVVNIMMYYESKNYPTITQKVSDTIANDWLKHNVKDPTEALEYIKDFKNRKQKGNYNHNKRSKPIPKWLNETTEQVDKKEIQIDISNMIKEEELKRKMLEGK